MGGAMIAKTVKEALFRNEYPGRGIIAGKSACGMYAVAAYWIMGRSENSRNRIFAEDGDGIRTQAFDASRLTDPSLVIYPAVRVLGNATIVTNGDQTDTVYEGLKKGLSLEASLRSRTFEPDAPNFTPRISAVLDTGGGDLSISLSILKSDGGNEESANRYTFCYENPRAGIGRYIHTYMQNGSPLPSFEGEPEIIELNEPSAAQLAEHIWSCLNEDNRVSLFVRYIEISTGKSETRIINKNGQS